MKLLEALIFVLLAFSPAYALSASDESKPPYAPHEDPAAAKEAVDAYSLLMYYGDVVSLISVKSYGDAARLIERLNHVHVPEELRYIVGRYNQLSLELTSALEDADKSLEEASRLLSQYRLEEASGCLRGTSVLLGRAGILLKDLQDSLGTLGNRLGVYTFPAGSRVAEAYSRLQDALRKLSELTEEYVKLLAHAKKEASSIEEARLEPTQVTLGLNATRAFVGATIKANGSLASNGGPLPDRTIALLLDGEAIATVPSKPDGSFEAILPVPFKYVHTIAMKALYTPLGQDVGVYLASESPPVALEIAFYETRLDVKAPEKAYPGLPFTVSIEAKSQPLAPRGRGVTLLLDGELLAEAETDARGFLEAEALVKPQTSTVRHILAVVVKPQGVYTGASQGFWLNVVKLMPEAHIQAPLLVVLPATVNVKGNASSSLGPLAQATVTLGLGEASSTVRTSEEGEFNATLEMPLSLILVGFHELKATVQPSEPWHQPAEAKVSVFILNVGNIALILSALIFIGATQISPTLRAKGEEKKAVAMVEPIEPLPRKEGLTEAPFPKPLVTLEGASGKVLEAYIKALRLVEGASRLSMEPSMTLREFVANVSVKLGGLAEPFKELTMLAEAALYAPYVLGEEEALRAESLASSLEEELLKPGSA